MTTLYVWGREGTISSIFPESLAAAWVMAESSHPVTVVTANNTNLSSIGKLPVLVTPEGKLQGYRAIARYARGKGPSDLVASGQLAMMANQFDALTNYVYFVNSRNYEEYTRKVFGNYFPFPMMYNQPLHFYNCAQRQAHYHGLNPNKGGLFSFDVVAPTETVDDDEEEEEEGEELPALSRLHERQLVKKSKSKAAIREAKNSARAIQMLSSVLPVFADLDEASVAYPLFVAYIHALTNPHLADHVIATNLEANQPEMVERMQSAAKRYQGLALEVRAPEGLEKPTLLNEVRYMFGQYV
ncbi:sorting assembly machinery 37 kDa subunit [Diutina catenulata]